MKQRYPLLSEIYREPAEKESEVKTIPDPRKYPTSEDAKVLRALELLPHNRLNGELRFTREVTWNYDSNEDGADDYITLSATIRNNSWRVLYSESNSRWVIKASAPTLKAAVEDIIRQGRAHGYQEVEPLAQALEPANLNRLLEYLFREDIRLDLDVGDVVLAGKWKNKRTVVKTIGTDDLGQPTINGQSLLTMRIEKTLPDDKKSKQTRDEESGKKDA
jgi:hypothetical protein